MTIYELAERVDVTPEQVLEILGWYLGDLDLCPVTLGGHVLDECEDEDEEGQVYLRCVECGARRSPTLPDDPF